MAAYIQELVRSGLYKKSQGRNARQVTLVSILVVVAAGVWSLREWMLSEGFATTPTTVVPLVVLAACAWAAFRLIQYPKFADFLISVEAEMNKVSWPSQGELIRASFVVIAVIFFLAALLLGYDALWKTIFGALLG
ncbi:preprotein translocase subunit SecE [Botrimarina hoheduenensis]|uniref:Protein translocase subunit SecE n=1 Tax=Botrimarina hoheduenensis TaxID=2528000 RepID=A0A5C5W6S3_9BACT|nr:preprotein translocase subunit SecE [Botrimarina hoheduenensis]TWT46618.1 preprotein translocase subunit SecE [Botrimarina hoheduenensis]